MNVRKILIIDDDKDFGESLARFLTARSIVCETAERGRKAQQLLAENKYDLLIVDGLLPDINGIELIKNLRANNRDDKIIFVSAFWRDYKTFRMLKEDYGVFAVFRKPASPEAIYIEVERALQVENGGAKDVVLREPMTEPEEEDCGTTVDTFLESLPDRIIELERLIEKFRGDQKLGSLAEARFIVHNLAGTAGIYGLNRLGNLSSKLQELIEPYVEKKKEIKGDDLNRRLSAMVGELRKEFDSGSRLATIAEVCETGVGEPMVDSYRFLAVTDNAQLKQQLDGFVARGNLTFSYAEPHSKLLELAETLFLDALLIDIDNDAKGILYKAAAEIRSTTDLQDLPIIFLCDEPSVTEELTALQAGGTSFLFNPINHDDLLETVRRLSSHRKTEKPRALILDDDPAFGERTKRVLERVGIEVLHVTDPRKIMENLSNFQPDLVMLDVMLPYVNGFEAANLIKSNPLWQELPLIFASSQTSPDVRIACYKSGGEDFLLKPILNEELLTRVKLRIEKARRFRQLGGKDVLTGLLTRKTFSSVLAFRTAEAERAGVHFSIALLNLNNLKLINEQYGYLFGDRVIASFGKLLLDRLRTEDISCRWEGDNIVVYLNLKKDKAREVLDRIREDFAKIEFTTENNKKVNATFSGAVVEFPDEGSRLIGLIDVAVDRLRNSRIEKTNTISIDS